MSLAGSIASMTARSRIVGGSGIWTMTPSTRRVVVERRGSAAVDAGLGRLAVELDEAGVDADLRAAAQDPLEVDHRRRVACRRSRRARPGGRPRRSRIARRRPRPTARRISVGDRPALEESRAAPRGHCQSRQPASGSRDSPLSDGLAGVRGQSLDLVRASVVDPERHLALRTPSSPTDGRLTRTFAAAPRAAASPSSDATFEVARRVDVAPARPAPRRAATSSTAGLDADQRDLGGAARRPPAAPPAAPPARRRCRGAASSPRRTPAYACGVLVGEVEEPVGQDADPVSSAQAWRSRVLLRTCGRPWDSAATIATSAAPRLAATAEALPPPGTGLADAERARRTPSRVRSRKRADAESSGTPPIVGCDPDATRPRCGTHRRASGPRSVGDGASAVPARPPATDGADAGGRAQLRRPGSAVSVAQAARRSSSSAGDRPSPRAVLDT